MSIQSDAAKLWIEAMLSREYGIVQTHRPTKQKDLLGILPQSDTRAFREYRFNLKRRWKFDWAVPEIKCAIELDGGLFIKGAHVNPASIRDNYIKSNDAAKRGWRVWRYLPEQIIKAGRKGVIEVLPTQHFDTISSMTLRYPARRACSYEAALAGLNQHDHIERYRHEKEFLPQISHLPEKIRHVLPSHVSEIQYDRGE